jgi:hypothetical protein
MITGSDIAFSYTFQFTVPLFHLYQYIIAAHIISVNQEAIIMTGQPRTQEQIDSHQSLGRWLRYLGIVLFLFGAYVSAFLIPDVIRTASGPQAMSLSEATEVANSEQTYARIEGGAWDCDTVTYVEGLSGSQLSYGRVREETEMRLHHEKTLHALHTLHTRHRFQRFHVEYAELCGV